MISKGTISKRKISGKDYYYHQYLENGKQVSKVISEFDAYRLGFSIYFKGEDDFLNHEFHNDVSYGMRLYALSSAFKKYKKRFIFKDIDNFIKDDSSFGKLLVLYGLRRTGKTTLMFQEVNEFSIKDFSKVAYIKCSSSSSMYKLFQDLEYLTDNHFKYIFIDEVTLLEDFITLSSTLSDIFALKAKIILTGTDSLGFMIASHHEIYDRVTFVHTTYIPFKEFSYILNLNSVDKYIEYGGTMSFEGIDYNKVVMVNNNYVNEYVDSSIVHNIVHSLRVYKDGKYFLNLYDLYEKNELVNVINRVIEDTNHRFAISVIENEFKSHDYGSLKHLLLLPNNYAKFGDILEKVDEEKLVSDLMNALSIINKEKQTHKIDDDTLKEVEEFLKELDVIDYVKEINIGSVKENKKVVFIQPGLRYSQVKELINILLKDESLQKYDQIILDALQEKLLSDVKGKMIEELVLYETTIKNNRTFKLYFSYNGEFDMVSLFKEENDFYSNVYEIKYSSIVDKNQYRFINDKNLCEEFENKYYPIKDRGVIYRGENTKINDIYYINIEDYLKCI